MENLSRRTAGRIAALAAAGCCAALLAAGPAFASSPAKSLRDAADKGDVAAVRAALRNGSKVDAKDPSTGDTALFAAAADNRDARVVSVLIKAGANVNVKDAGGMTALMVAGKADIAKALIKAGADVNAADNQGWTPLIYAVSKATMDKSLTPVVGVLVKAGAKIEMKDKDGDTAVSLAKKAKATRLVALLARARKPARR